MASVIAFGDHSPSAALHRNLTVDRVDDRRNHFRLRRCERALGGFLHVDDVGTRRREPLRLRPPTAR